MPGASRKRPTLLTSRTIALGDQLGRPICALVSGRRERHGIALRPAEATAQHGANARSNSGRWDSSLGALPCAPRLSKRPAPPQINIVWVDDQVAQQQIEDGNVASGSTAVFSDIPALGPLHLSHPTLVRLPSVRFPTCTRRQATRRL